MATGCASATELGDPSKALPSFSPHLRALPVENLAAVTPWPRELRAAGLYDRGGAGGLGGDSGIGWSRAPTN
jgi:hypothetical protein